MLSRDSPIGTRARTVQRGLRRPPSLEKLARDAIKTAEAMATGIARCMAFGMKRPGVFETELRSHLFDISESLAHLLPPLFSGEALSQTAIRAAIPHIVYLRRQLEESKAFGRRLACVATEDTGMTGESTHHSIGEGVAPHDGLSNVTNEVNSSTDLRPKPLTRKQQAALDIIRREGPILGEAVAAKIGVKYETFRRGYVPVLKQQGVQNHRNGEGYYLPQRAST